MVRNHKGCHSIVVINMELQFQFQPWMSFFIGCHTHCNQLDRLGAKVAKRNKEVSPMCLNHNVRAHLLWSKVMREVPPLRLIKINLAPVGSTTRRTLREGQPSTSNMPETQREGLSPVDEVCSTTRRTRREGQPSTSKMPEPQHEGLSPVDEVGSTSKRTRKKGQPSTSNVPEPQRAGSSPVIKDISKPRKRKGSSQEHNQIESLSIHFTMSPPIAEVLLEKLSAVCRLVVVLVKVYVFLQRLTEAAAALASCCHSAAILTSCCQGAAVLATCCQDSDPASCGH